MGFDDFISNLTSQFSTSAPKPDGADQAGTKGDQSRSAAQAQNTTLQQGFHGEYLPEQVSQYMEAFDVMSHQKIHDYRESIDLNGMNATVTAWKKLADDANKHAESFHTDMEKLINGGWSGAAAESAKNNVRKYVEDVNSLQNAAKMVAGKLDDATATLTQVKAQIPDIPKSRSHSITSIVTDVVATVAGPGTGIASIGGHLMADHGRASNAENEARDVMNNVYKKYLPEADTNVPKMPGVTQAATTPNGASGPVGPSQSYGPYTYNSTSHSYGPSTSNNLTGASGPSDSTSASTSPSSLNLPDAKTGSSFAPTGLSGPSTSGLSGSNTATAGYSPSGFGTAGTTGGGGFGGGLGGGSIGGGPGGSVPGGAAAAKAAGTPIAGITGTGNTGMGGGMMGGGKKGEKGEEDGEHKTPDWLKGIQEELLGPEPKTLPGGVIGGDYTES